MIDAEGAFASEEQSAFQHWRSIVLFGNNVASYKFALAKSLLMTAAQGLEVVTLEDLAVPFSQNICEHLQSVDRQGTFAHSRFLDGCRHFNAGSITHNELRELTALLGFNNVLDAFHKVRGRDVPTQFFIDERDIGGRIRLTEDLLSLATESVSPDLNGETESRWRLVESAWSARARNETVLVLYDAPREILVPALFGKRRAITEIRPALNGYQMGHCFYCFRPISFTSLDAGDPVDVDHFFPHALMSRGLGVDLDAPWNLVLACQSCNRGEAGKGARIPHEIYLERLHDRNEFLIGSQHPLKDTLIQAMGRSPHQRTAFLRSILSEAITLASGIGAWQTPALGPAPF